MQSEEWKLLKTHHSDVANNLLERVVTYKGEPSRLGHYHTPKRIRLNDLTQRLSVYGNNINGQRLVFQQP